MTSDFHVFMSFERNAVRVEKEGDDDGMEFPSLHEATRHLRNSGGGFVVIHDIDNRSTNRIPLAWPA